MLDTFSEITTLSRRLHFLWSKAGQRRATDEDRVEMKQLQWRTLPHLWHLHRIEVAKLNTLAIIERQEVDIDALDDYLQRARLIDPRELLRAEGFHVETLSHSRRTFTEEALNAQRIDATAPHRLPLRELHTSRGKRLLFTVGAGTGRVYTSLGGA